MLENLRPATECITQEQIKNVTTSIEKMIEEA